MMHEARHDILSEMTCFFGALCNLFVFLSRELASTLVHGISVRTENVIRRYDYEERGAYKLNSRTSDMLVHRNLMCSLKKYGRYPVLADGVYYGSICTVITV